MLVLAPQMIARIHTAVVPVRRMIHGLLIRIGRHHPQAGPLTLSTSTSNKLLTDDCSAVPSCSVQLMAPLVKSIHSEQEGCLHW